LFSTGWSRSKIQANNSRLEKKRTRMSLWILLFTNNETQNRHSDSGIWVDFPFIKWERIPTFCTLKKSHYESL
jgi:hypothetical protein